MGGELGEARSAEAVAQQSLVAAQNQQDLQQQGAAYQEQLDTIAELESQIASADGGGSKQPLPAPQVSTGASLFGNVVVMQRFDDLPRWRLSHNNFFTAHMDCVAALDRRIDEEFLMARVLMEPDEGGHLLVEPVQAPSDDEEE